MEITPEDIKRGSLECLATFEISEDGSELELKDIDSHPVAEEGESEEEVDDAPVEVVPGGPQMSPPEGGASAIPSEDDTIMGFVHGQIEKQKKTKKK